MKECYTTKITEWKDRDFEDFIEENSSMFYAFACRYIKDNQDIKDILQECYIKMWSSRSKISSLESPFNYIFTMIKNRSLNYLRDNKKVDIGLDHISSLKNVEYRDDYESVAFEVECSKAIADAILELSPQSQTVLNMIIDGKTMEQIAVELNISINSVKTIKYRAVDRLTKSLPPRMLVVLFAMFIFESANK